jgi:outer membrane lipoprotein SlyB
MLTKDEVTLEEVLELVDFKRDEDGKMRVVNVWGSILGTVRGSILGTVEGSILGTVEGSVWGDVKGDVEGTVEGSVWGTVWRGK